MDIICVQLTCFIYDYLHIFCFSSIYMSCREVWQFPIWLCFLSLNTALVSCFAPPVDGPPESITVDSEQHKELREPMRTRTASQSLHPCARLPTHKCFGQSRQGKKGSWRDPFSLCLKLLFWFLLFFSNKEMFPLGLYNSRSFTLFFCCFFVPAKCGRKLLCFAKLFVSVAVLFSGWKVVFMF